MSIKVYDDFLPITQFEDIKKQILNESFPWYFNNNITSLKGNDSLQDSHFVHLMYNNGRPQSNYLDILNPIFYKLEVFSLIRVKINCKLYTDQPYISEMHNDIIDSPNSVNIKTAVFYLNTNNGYTMFESNNMKIESIENRLVLFDEKERHCACTQTDSKARFVININYIPKN